MVASRKSVAKSILLLLLLLISSTPVSYTLGEEIETVVIGVIFPNENWMNFMEPVVSLAKEDINQFMAENEYKYRVEFIYKNAEQNQEIHLEKLIELKEEDIDLVIGCIWTMFANLSVGYANENQIIMISPSATGDPTIWGDSDNYFRLAPTDYSRFQVLSEFIWSQGEKACIIIGPEDIRTKEDTQLFEEILQLLGIESTIVTFEEHDEIPDIENVIIQLERAISEFNMDYSLEQIAIFDHPTTWGSIAQIANALLENEVNQEITWYSIQELIHNPAISEELEPESAVLRFYFPHVYLQDSVQYRNVNDRYKSIIGSDLGLYNASLYDTCWLYANSILEAESQSYDEVIELILYAASTYEGITGTLLLDVNGDRISPDYSIMGLADAPEVTFEKYGYYNARTSEIIWTSLSPRNELTINPDIIIENNGPYRGKLDEEIYFSAEGTYLLTGDIHSYRWSFGDGSFSFEKNPVHIYYLPGTYQVKLRVVDAQGMYQESETECTITTEGNISPIARAQVTQPYYCYVNDSLEFSSIESYDEDGEIVGILWDFGDGETSTDQIITHTFTERDLFEVTLTVTDDEGASQQDTVKCYVMNKPTVQIEGPYTRKKGEPITFYASVIFDDFDEDNMVEEYEWSLEGSFSKSYEENPTHIFNSEGIFPISVKITDRHGNEVTNVAEFTIIPTGVKIFGFEISMDTLRDYSGWILGAIVAIITIVGAGSGAIRNIVNYFNQSSDQERFYAVLKKRLKDLEKTYENDPKTLASELLGLKDELLSLLRDRSITMKHYTLLDEEIDKVLDNSKK
jgi:PKD repeat protein